MPCVYFVGISAAAGWSETQRGVAGELHRAGGSVCYQGLDTALVTTENTKIELGESIRQHSTIICPWPLFGHQVSELESSLSACRQELSSNLQQMDEMKKNYESELQANKDKVQSSIQWQSFKLWDTLTSISLKWPPSSIVVPFSGVSSAVFLPPQVSSLQEKLQGANLVCQNSGEQNLQLQLSLQLQQTMLTESTAHISELEESQSQLQKQVS